MMSFAALSLAATAVATSVSALPYYKIPGLDLHFSLPKIGRVVLEPFGIIVALGVILGAELLRKRAVRHGADEDDIRSMISWVAISGFVGAHLFDVLVYQPGKLAEDPALLLRFWQGISSYGGILGAAIGFAFFVWWKRLTPGMWADAVLVGFVPGFTIGRVACTVVHDHVGRATDFALGFDYPRRASVAGPLRELYPGTSEFIRAHNLGLYELLYLIPVCGLILYLGLWSKRRFSAGFLAVLAGVLYAPVRFFLEYLRLTESDPRYAGLTFAQWVSIAAFLVSGYVALRLLKTGKVAKTTEELGDLIGGRLVPTKRKPPAPATATSTDKK